MASQRGSRTRSARAKARKDHSKPSTGATVRVATLRSSMPRLSEHWVSGRVWCPAIFTTPVVKWSQKTGRSAKVYPKPLRGYENGETPELYRSV